MVSTELILGMEEMVNHIRELEEKNKKLEEENKKIGELVISQTDKLKEVSIKYNEGYKINQELKEENKKLKEENKKLKEKEEEYQPKGSQVDPEGLHDYMKEEIDKLKKENYEKQGTIESLEDDLEECNEYRNMFGEFYEPDEFEALDEENNYLKEDLKTQTTRANAWEKSYHAECEENKKLKEEKKQYEYESCESVVTEQKIYGQLFQFQAEINELKGMRDVICQELYMCERDKRYIVDWGDLVVWTEYNEHKARIEKTFDEEDRIKKD